MIDSISISIVDRDDASVAVVVDSSSSSPFLRSKNAMKNNNTTDSSALASNNNNNNNNDIIQDCQYWNDRFKKSRSTSSDEAIARQKEFSKSLCGSLWLGLSSSSSQQQTSHHHGSSNNIQFVIAHCNNNLSWMYELVELFQNTRGYNIKMNIYSKCGKENEMNTTVLDMVKDQNNVMIETLPNVGGCDHTYAHWLTKYHPDNTDVDYDHVIFLKDTFRGKVIRILQTLLKASITNGSDFGCGAAPPAPPIPLNVTYMNIDDVNEHPITKEYGWATYSSLHYTERLYQFNMANYKRLSDRLGLTNETNDDEEDAPFRSNYENLHHFMSHILQINDNDKNTNIWPTSLAHVCYSGLFASTRRGIQRTPSHVFQRLEQSLSRGNNIEEGHYAERMWASFFQRPITTIEVEAITKHFMDGVVLLLPGQVGMLTRML